VVIKILEILLLLKEIQHSTNANEKDVLIKQLQEKLEAEKIRFEKYRQLFLKENQLLSEQRIPPTLNKLWRPINY